MIFSGMTVWFLIFDFKRTGEESSPLRTLNVFDYEDAREDIV